MNTTHPLSPGLRALGWLALSLLLLGCAGLAMGAATSQALQLNDGVVKAQDQDGNWEPLAGDATFELTGTLENTEPWTVAGQALSTNAATQIAQGLQTGQSVHVQGSVLEDGTWLAHSIAPAEAQPNTEPTVILIGVVDSVNPWVINGLELNVTATTEVQGDIQPGTIVRAEILLQDNGTWEVLRIAPLGQSTPTPGCATVIATVASVNGNQVQFVGWPAPVTWQTNDPNGNNQENINNANAGNENDANRNENEDPDDDQENENGSGNVGLDTLQPGQQVQALVCVDADGRLVITRLTVLGGQEPGADQGAGTEKVLVCHKPNSKKGGHTLSIAAPAVDAHLGHGDTLGPCP